MIFVLLNDFMELFLEFLVCFHFIFLCMSCILWQQSPPVRNYHHYTNSWLLQTNQGTSGINLQIHRNCKIKQTLPFLYFCTFNFNFYIDILNITFDIYSSSLSINNKRKYLCMIFFWHSIVSTVFTNLKCYHGDLIFLAQAQVQVIIFLFEHSLSLHILQSICCQI